MKNHYLILPGIVVALFLIPTASISQTTHNVAVTNNKFEPASLSIKVGDTVKWTCTQGSHNVNGTTATFPSNPESFGNSVGSGWVFSHTFMTAGEYQYQCDPHVALGMTGGIAVSPISSVKESLVSNSSLVASIYPQPAAGFVVIEFSKELPTTSLWSVNVYNLAGQEVSRTPLSGTPFRLETGNWTAGTYFFHLANENRVVESGTFVVQ